MAIFNGPVSPLSSRQQLATEGKMFAVTNPTPGTAIAHALLTAFSATANGLFLIQNNAPSGGKSIVLDRLSLCQTATAPTGTLVKHFEIYNESGIVTLSGNFAARTPVNLNPSHSSATVATVQSFAAGAGTVPAAVGSRRLVGLVTMPTGVTVIHDTFVLDFGGDSQVNGKNGGAAARATDAATIVQSAPPVVIAPQTTSWINMWWVTAAANTPSYEFCLTYAEVEV